MTSQEIRSRFLDFFKERGHAVISSASLVPENDPSVLFNTAGMQPLVPYLLGEKHPLGTRLASAQKCVRTVDIDSIGDNTHATFFEMLGNWSLGDYWKKEAIEWSYEFLTSKSFGLGLDPQRLYVTCFEGDNNAPRDNETAEIWKNIFVKNNVSGERIYFRSAESNWWPQPKEKDEYSGPCGPDTEMFYDLTGELTLGMTNEEYDQADSSQKIVEIWNDVFMEYLKKDGKVVSKLESNNIDTGSGFERLVAVVQDKKNIFETDLFLPLIRHIKEQPSISDQTSERIVVDHVRTAIFMIADGVLPSNTDRGYILRRLVRRAVRHADKLKLPEKFLSTFVPMVEEIYMGVYPEITAKKADIISELLIEETKFRKTLTSGLKHLNKLLEKGDISGDDAFMLLSSYGFPLEITEEIAKESGYSVDSSGFQVEFLKHQTLSRAGSGEKFKGGLKGTGEIETKYHTATHLLHQALRDVLGSEVSQKGSNITAERLRFDFTFGRKLTEEELHKIEKIVNEKIEQKLPVNSIVLKKSDAEKTGALHFFDGKYGDEVNVYFIGNSMEDSYSKEFCGGPHVQNTEKLGCFKIIKEEAVSQGIRRIKAILE
ncbi:alanine--tRNA ligase [Patescibacteria group bacterium]|nr:alanine--tRNA ligase [Patescibacteria group bacterium]